MAKVIKDNAQLRIFSGAEGVNQGAQRVDDTKTTISRAFKGAAHWQIITTILLALAAGVLAGAHAAASVCVGGASVLLGGYAGVATMRSQNNPTPGVILIALLKAEAVRILVIVLLLLVAFKFYQGLVPLALVGGLAVAVLISGAGLRTLGNENK